MVPLFVCVAPSIHSQGFKCILKVVLEERVQNRINKSRTELEQNHYTVSPEGNREVHRQQVVEQREQKIREPAQYETNEHRQIHDHHFSFIFLPFPRRLGLSRAFAMRHLPSAAHFPSDNDKHVQVCEQHDQEGSEYERGQTDCCVDDLCPSDSGLFLLVAVETDPQQLDERH